MFGFLSKTQKIIFFYIWKTIYIGLKLMNKNNIHHIFNQNKKTEININFYNFIF